MIEGNYTYTVTARRVGCAEKQATVSVRVAAPVVAGRCLSLGDQCSGNASEIRSFTLDAATGGSNPLTLRYRSHEGAGQVRIRINEGSWQTVSLKQTPGDLSYASADLVGVALTKGANTVELASGGGFLCFRELCLGTPHVSTRRGVAEELTDLPVELAVEAYPNPSSGAVILRVRTSVSGAGTVEVLDLTGRAVQRRSVELRAGDNALTLDVESQPAGLYILRVRDAAGRQGAVRLGRQ